MSYSWSDLDLLLRWNVRREPTLPARLVHEAIVADGTWRVLSKRGTRASGNRDPIALIEPPNASIEVIESLKQLVDDLGEKSTTARDWMRLHFMPALIKVVTFGTNPSEHVLPDEPSLSGYPPEVLLSALQVIALSEHRKYWRSEPFGGKYLLVRVCTGLAWGVWTTADASYGVMMQNSVAILRAQTGIREPTLGFVLAHSMSDETLAVSREELEALSL